MVDQTSDLRRPGERRATRSHFRLHERRTGFDRRVPGGLLLYLRDRPVVVVGLLVALNVLSAVDWAFSLHAFSIGAVEGNPVLSSMIAVSPLSAALFKASIILTVSLFLWTGRAYRLILATTVLALAVYGAVAAYHLATLATLVAAR